MTVKIHYDIEISQPVMIDFENDDVKNLFKIRFANEIDNYAKEFIPKNIEQTGATIDIIRKELEFVDD